MIKKPHHGASRSEREAYVKAWAAITISIFALLLAVNGYYGGSNSSRVLGKTIEANNLWAWYDSALRSFVFSGNFLYLFDAIILLPQYPLI